MEVSSIGAARKGAGLTSGTSKKPQKTVLVVDDDPAVVEIIGLSSQGANLTVLSARNGAQALSKACKSRPDIILLDAVLPDMDGLEVCRRLKANDETRQIPVVLMNSEVRGEDLLAGMCAGAEDYVTKPLGPSEVASVIGEHLAHPNPKITTNRLIALPGSATVYDRIRALISESRFFAVMYLDIVYSRGFSNDSRAAYSSCAIRLLMETASEALQLFGNTDDLVGYLDEGGLVVITTPQRAETLCRRIINQFDDQVGDLCAAAKLDPRFVLHKDQRGQREKDPLISVSIAVVTNHMREIRTPLEVEKLAAELRSGVICQPGSTYRFDKQQDNSKAALDNGTAWRSSGYGRDAARMPETLSRIYFMTQTLGAATNLIKGSLESFLSARVDNLDSLGLNDLMLIQRRASQLLSVVNELEKLGGVEWAVTGTLTDIASLKDIIELDIGLLKWLAVETGVEICLDASEKGNCLMVGAGDLVKCIFYLLRSEVKSSLAGDQIAVRVSKATKSLIEVDVENRRRCIPSRELANLLRFEPHRSFSVGPKDDLLLALALAECFGGELKVNSNEKRGTILTLSIPTKWQSRVGQVKCLLSERDKSTKAARTELAKVNLLVSSTVEKVPQALQESLQNLEYKNRELEVLCNLSLLLADGLSNDLERCFDRVVELEAEHITSLETILALVSDTNGLKQGGRFFDLIGARRVSVYALGIAAELELSRDEKIAIHHAALLKDLGPALVRSRMRDTGGGLDSIGRGDWKRQQYAAVKAGSRLWFLESALSIVYHKYAKYDGTTHPSGLNGEEIPMGARILAVAEAADGLIRNMSPSEVLELEVMLSKLTANSERQLDPHVVSAFLKAIKRGRISINYSSALA